MKLIECYIENFGGLSGRKISFAGGLNTVKAENGYGKTTLSVFIKAMLFGLDTTKKTRLDENDRKHYTPWQGGRFGGSLTFESAGKTYRIERSFSHKAAEDTFILYDVTTGKTSTAFSENIGEELFGIDADGFERTVFLSEANLSGKNENKSVSAKLSNLVGYEGDLGVMDEAVLLLDKQRKRYYKRGGGGEIGDIKQRVAALTSEINSLEAMKVECDDAQKRLAEAVSELDAANRKKKELLEAVRIAEEARLKGVYIKQYRDMLSAVKRDEEAKSHLYSFFERRIPTQEEINIAREKKREAESLLESAKSNTAPEFSSLREFFPEGLEDEDYENAKRLSDKRDKIEHQRTLVDFELASIGDFEYNRADLCKNTHNTRWGAKKIKTFSTFSITVGILAIAIGAVLGYFFSTFLFALSVFGAVLSLTGAVTLFISFKFSLESKATDDALIQKKERKKNLLFQLNAIEREIAALDEKLQDFIGKFPIEKTNHISAAIDTVMRKRELYLALSENENFSAKRREEDSLRAKRCNAEADAFIALFPTVSSQPFDEISTKLVEYTALCRSLERMKKSLYDFSREHGIDESSLREEAEYNNVPNPENPVLNGRIDELVRSRALLERQCRVMSEEIDRIDELTSERDALIEKAREYESRLDIIRKTMDYLAEAKDLLTAKYLSKTKNAFDKYLSLIGNETSEEFHMDTSFAVKKNERGSLKDTEAYSRGTRDLYALATRFALIESLYEEERPFVILDDPFAYFDDEHLARAKKTLKALAKDRQIIYLTCSEARNI